MGNVPVVAVEGSFEVVEGLVGCFMGKGGGEKKVGEEVFKFVGVSKGVKGR